MNSDGILSKVLIVLIGLECLLYPINSETTENQVTACFSSDKCGFFTLECQDGQVIKIKSLSYGWKPIKDPLCANITTHCEYSSLCCSYNTSDTVKDFTHYQAHAVYQKCSGKRSCHDVRATSTYLDSSHPKPDTLSTYVVVIYTCIDGTSIVDFCANGSSIGKVLNLVFDPGKALDAVNKRRLVTCTCAVESNMSFSTSLVDARLACRKQGLYCDHPVISGISGLSSRCVSGNDESDYFYHDKLIRSEGLEFNVTFDSLCPPSYLWLQANGTDNLNITCSRFLLQEITTTTTTTTTTTISTTAGTKSLFSSSIRPTRSNSSKSVLETSTVRNGSQASDPGRTTTVSTGRNKSGLGVVSTEIWVAIGGGVAGVILISCIGYCCWKKRQTRMSEEIQHQIQESSGYKMRKR